MESSLTPPYLEKTDPWSSHSRIVAWLTSFPKGAIVLDIGAATGMIGKSCSGFGLYLKGLEPNHQWAEVARVHYDEFVACNFEEVDSDFVSDADVVVLADVLEHLVDPNSVLRRLVKLQHSGCRFIVSVPNIANIWIRLSLLLGKFEYSDRGILDRTHLHFYTRTTFQELLAQSGLQVTKLVVTPIPLNFVHPFFQSYSIGRSFHFLLAKTSDLFPSLFGYQFLALAVIKNS